MTHLQTVSKSEFAAISSGILPFFHLKNRNIKIGDKMIFQEMNEKGVIEDEYPCTLTHIHQADGVASKWSCISWKQQEIV